jgi:adenosylcobinamide-phosphate synthase
VEAAAAVAVAVLLDAAFGEPPVPLHPVVWLGTLAGVTERRAPAGLVRQLAYGAALALGLPALAAAAVVGIASATRRLPLPLRVLITGAALKPCFAIRGLVRAGAEVESRLAAGEIEAARRGLRSLVSRDTSELGAGPVAAAAIESLAENLTDSVVAPLLAFALFGLPGACAYRAINTLDSMIGYRGRYEWLGKSAACLDDLVNLFPARLSALLIAAAAPLAGGTARAALRTAHRDHWRTASPNAGWTMAAMAGALGVRLEKRGHYLLNEAAPEPGACEIGRARRVALGAAAAGTLGAAALAMLTARWRQ